MSEQIDHLAHYGVPGMKWGKRKAAARREKNAQIDGARARQAGRKAEVQSLTAKRMTERSAKGKAYLDRKIADKKFEIDNGDDAQAAKQLKTGEKFMKGAKVAAMIGMSVAGLGVAANIINTELNRIDNAENFPMSIKEYDAENRLRRGEKVSWKDIQDGVADTNTIRDKLKR